MALNLLGRFNILNGTYFTGYSTGDVIEIFYNDSTDVIEKYKNGGGLSGGPVISKWHVDNNYVTATVANYEFCDGTTLNTFSNIYDPSLSWYPSFPYFNKRQVLNSPSCSTVVCDILQKGNPLVVQATSGAADGSISVTFSSSAVVRFALVDVSDRPAYENMQAATTTSGSDYNKTFSNLREGTYTIYALDANGCSSFTFATVTADITAAYADKYYFDFKDWQDVTHRCTIKENGFAGSATELNYSGPTPVKLMWGSTSSQDKLNTILGGSMMIQLVSETDQQWADEFKVIDEKQYQVEVTQGANVIQRGYIVPDIYEEPYIEEPYIVTGLRIVDGLADLQNVTYTVTPWTEAEGWKDGQRITGDQSIIDILTTCLSKTGIKQNIRSCINYYAAEHNSTATDDPLKQTYINNSCFVVDDEPLSCFEVIRSLLSSLPDPCSIFSAEGVWYVWPIKQTSSTVDYREFDTTGTYSSNGTITSITDIDSIVNGANLRYEGVFNSINAIENRIISDQLVSDFIPENIQPSGLPTGWNTQLNGDSGRFAMDAKNEYLEAQFDVDQNGNAYIVSKITGNDYNSGEQINISIDYRVDKKFEYNPPYIKLRFMVKAGTKYLGLDGNWYSYEIINEQLVRNYNSDEKLEFSAVFDEVGTDAEIEIRLYSVTPFKSDFVGGTTFSSLQALIEAEDIDNWTGNSDAIPLGYSIMGSVDNSALYGAGAKSYFYFSLQAADTGNNTRDSNVTASVRNNSLYEWTYTDGVSVVPPTNQTSRSYITYINGLFIKYKSISVGTSSITNQDDSVKFNTLIVSSNNAKTLNYDLSFFDIDEKVPNAEKRVQNYWKLSTGSPISTGWNSSDLAQTNVKSQDFIKTFLGQLYKFPTKTLTLNGRQDTHLYPYHVMRRSSDNGLIMKWDRLEWDMKMMLFNGQGSEVGSNTAVVLKAFKDNAFTNGFS